MSRSQSDSLENKAALVILGQLRARNERDMHPFDIVIPSNEYFRFVSRRVEPVRIPSKACSDGDGEQQPISEDVASLKKHVSSLQQTLLAKQRRIFEDAAELQELRSELAKLITQQGNQPGQDQAHVGWTTAQSIRDAVSYVGSSAWKATQGYVNPTYWVPDDEITECFKCNVPIAAEDPKHHCRQCGLGFCPRCSTGRRRVPSKGWDYPVRVCDLCWNNEDPDEPPKAPVSSGSEDTIAHETPEAAAPMAPETPSSSYLSYYAPNMARKMGELVVSAAASAAATAAPTVKGAVGRYLAPAYWVPDEMCKQCHSCNEGFSESSPIHHCRHCGFGFCGKCSEGRRECNARGWTGKQRVCNACALLPDTLPE